MDLLKYNADHIVREIPSVINRDINFMNEDGVIIASTDKTRIGQSHAGARHIIEEHLDELIVKKDDNEAGVKEGANYPIKIGGEIVGVIGITGEWEQTAKFGRITQKMTQILMTELSIKEHKSFQESQMSRYILEWVTSEHPQVGRAFVQRGKQMDVDITLPRRFLIVSLHISERYKDSYEANWDAGQGEEKIRNYIRRIDRFCIIIKLASRLLIGIGNRSDREMQTLAEGIYSLVPKREYVRVDIGIDEKSYPYTSAFVSYRQAYKALKSSMRQPEGGIKFYRDINVEVFIDEVSTDAKNEFVKKLFAGFDPDEIEPSLELVEILYKNDGSINAASESLHMHKNTLQYKLRKIWERTGYDPRSISSAHLFGMAIEFYRDLNGEFYD